MNAGMGMGIDRVSSIETRVHEWQIAQAEQLAGALERLHGHTLVRRPSSPAWRAALYHAVYYVLQNGPDVDEERNQELFAMVNASDDQGLPRVAHQAMAVKKTECVLYDDPRHESTVYCCARPPKEMVALDDRILRRLLDTDLEIESVFTDVGIVVFLERQRFDRTTRSYTVNQFHGTIFCDWTDSPVRNAEILLHEATHTWLNTRLSALQETLPAEPSWFSPWKGTERPAHGILHAVAAFSVLTRVWRLAAELCDGEERVYCRCAVDQTRQNLERVRRSFEKVVNLLQSAELRRVLTVRYQAAFGGYSAPG